MKWEYKVVDLGVASTRQTLEGMLNDSGRDGWELCELSSLLTAKWLIFKRQVQQ